MGAGTYRPPRRLRTVRPLSVGRGSNVVSMVNTTPLEDSGGPRRPDSGQLFPLTWPESRPARRNLPVAAVGVGGSGEPEQEPPCGAPPCGLRSGSPEPPSPLDRVRDCGRPKAAPLG